MVYIRVMDYSVVKALHLIFMATWFAGLYSGFRLFTYHAEASKKPDPERTILMRQFAVMEGRIWHFMAWPSCVLTLVFGLWLAILKPGIWAIGAFHLKLLLVIVLVLFQLYGERMLRKLRNGVIPHSSIRFRVLNEVPTAVLIAVVFIIVLKDQLSWVWGMIGFVGMAALIGLAVVKYRKAHPRKNEQAGE